MSSSNKQENIRYVVLDDDPTGIQTVHGNLLLTNWALDTIRKALRDHLNFFYILTNSRSLNQRQAGERIREIVRAVEKVNQEFGFKLVYISRSDSTLRSNFPAEVNAILEVLGQGSPDPTGSGRLQDDAVECRSPNNDNQAARVSAARVSAATDNDAVILVPEFFEGNRITVGNVHYIKESDGLLRADESEFSRDSVFGYSSSHMPTYIEEKTGGKVKREDVICIPRWLFTVESRESLYEVLRNLSDNHYVMINAVNYSELQVFCAIVREVMAEGKRFQFHTAASFVKAITETSDKPLLDRSIITNPGKPGLFVIGSHVKKTTAQLNTLLSQQGTIGIEVDVAALLDAPEEEKERVLSKAEEAWHEDKTPVLYTSREELTFENADARLEAGTAISRFLVELVVKFPFQPSFLVAKGGITSNDVLKEGLGVDTARVVGQVLPGVPVIKTGPGHRWADLPYVIFPGNVGDENSLVEVLDRFSSV